MFKSIDIKCSTCQEIYTVLVDVPSGSPLPPFAECEVCGNPEAKRIISFTIAKAQIQERCHGGELINGKIVRRDTGLDAVKQQHSLSKRLKKARKAGDAETAREVQKELVAKQQEAVKKL